MAHLTSFIPSLNRKFGAPGTTIEYVRHYICSLCRTKLSNHEIDIGCHICSNCNKFLCESCNTNSTCTPSER